MPAWIAWTLGYAVAVWAVDTIHAQLGPWLENADRRGQDRAEAIRFLIPLLLALLIGVWLRAWWWVLSPFLAIILPMLAFSIVDYLKRPRSQRQQAATGLIFGIGATTFDAGLAALSAFAGVVIGTVWPGG